MKQSVDEAYVLRTQPLGEADLIVSLLAESHGKLRGVARSARRSRRRFGGALEPLTRVRVEWSEKVGRDLHRIDSLDCLRSHAEMQADPELQAACAVLAEVSEAFARESEPDPDSFRLLGAVIEALELGRPVWPLIRYFELWTLQLHGLLPEWNRCAVCHDEIEAAASRQAVRGFGVCCTSCGEARDGPRRLGTRHREFLQAARRASPADFEGDEAIAGPGTSLELLLRRTLEQFAERRFRSYRHLRAAGRPPAAPAPGEDR